MNGMNRGGNYGPLGMGQMESVPAREALGAASGIGREVDMQCGPKSPVEAEIALLYEQLRDLGHAFAVLEKTLTPVIPIGPSPAEVRLEPTKNQGNPPPRGSSPVVVELRGLRHEIASLAQLVRVLHQQIEV